MGQVSTFAGLALVSAVIACFVPGISDASGAPPVVSAVGSNVSASAGSVGSSAIRVIAAIERPAVTVPVPAGVPTITVRRRIMVGCERAVSPLVRSAEAAQIARCIT